MYLVVASKEDPASMNIRRFMVPGTEWKVVGQYDGNEVLSLEDKTLLVTINDFHLFHDDIDKKVSEALETSMPEVVIYLSRHKSESGLKTLTLHPIGCYTTADFGGRARTLVPSAPAPMTAALRLLTKEAETNGMDFKVSFECTHHGPYLESPTFFIEIGSSEDVWPEEKPGRVLSSVVLALLKKMHDASSPESSYPVAIGVGGGHYAPRFTEVALKNKVSIGHMIPTYAVRAAEDEDLSLACKMTPGAKMAYFHRKSLKGAEYRRLKDLFMSMGLEVVREKDLEPL